MRCIAIHQCIDHVGVVVNDLQAATAIFLVLGMELECEAAVEARSVDRVVGLDDVRVDVATVRTPTTKFHTPWATTAEPHAPADTLELRRIISTWTTSRARGAEVVGELKP